MAEGDWTRHFEALAPIRQLGSFHLYAGRWQGRACVVAAAASSVDPETAADRIAAAVAANAGIDHPAVPPIITHGREADTPFLAYGTAARHDLGHLLALAGRPGPHPGELAAYVLLMVSVLAAVPADRDVHRLGVANVLVDDDGGVAVLGLGCDLLAHQGPALPAVSLAPGAARRALVR
ncbi:MAG: hypothetical protein KC613_15500, partial [Myxococcales bacterium]|nr:hypothetical protein [Myxococcales bacterium]